MRMEFFGGTRKAADAQPRRRIGQQGGRPDGDVRQGSAAAARSPAGTQPTHPLVPRAGTGAQFSYRAEGAETRKNENCFRAAVVNQGHLATGSSARCHGVGGRVHVVAVAPQ